MWWYRAAILVACGLLLHCTSSVKTGSQQSYREALRRRLSAVAWHPPPRPAPCGLVPYPYRQTNSPNPRSANNIITQNTAAGWPECRIKLPLYYMGRPIKINMTIELPLCMFPRSKQTGVINNAVTSSSSSSSSIPPSSSSSIGSSGSSMTDKQGSSQSVLEDNTSTLPPEHVSQQTDSAHPNPNEIIKNDISVSKEGNTFEDNNDESPVDNTTDYVPDANHGGRADCIGAKLNDPVDAVPNSVTLVSQSDPKENILEPIIEPANPNVGELTTNIEHAVANNEEIVDDTENDATENESTSENVIQDDGAIETQPQTEEETHSERRIVDGSKTTDCKENGTKTEKSLESCPQTEDETNATEDAECSTPRTDDGTEIAPSAGSEATLTD